MTNCNKCLYQHENPRSYDSTGQISFFNGYYCGKGHHKIPNNKSLQGNCKDFKQKDNTLKKIFETIKGKGYAHMK